MSDDLEDAREPLTPDVVSKLVASHRELLRFVEKRVGDRALAEDILQDAFVRSIERGAEIREDTALAWLYRTLRNAIVDTYRRRGASIRRLEALARELEAESAPDAELERTICGCVEELAATLKPEYGAALRRVEIDGVAVKDLAREAGITENNAAVRVFRARRALADRVRTACGTCADHGCLDCHCRERTRAPSTT